MSKTNQNFKLAKLARDKRVTNLTELYGACECEFPLRVVRNRHGHGKTVDGKPCPAIKVWERQQAERAELQALAEEA